MQYYTGQCFPMEIITKKAKDKVSTIFFCTQEVFHSHWKLAVKKAKICPNSFIVADCHSYQPSILCASHADQLSQKFRAVSVDGISHTQLETFPWQCMTGTRTSPSSVLTNTSIRAQAESQDCLYTRNGTKRNSLSMYTFISVIPVSWAIN